jgi:hypothetical protein
MKTFTRSSLLTLAVAATVQAGAIPFCSAVCITNAIAETGCSAWDTGCICSSELFLPAVTECSENGCHGEDIDTSLDAAQDYCKAVGITFQAQDLKKRSLDTEESAEVEEELEKRDPNNRGPPSRWSRFGKFGGKDKHFGPGSSKGPSKEWFQKNPWARPGRPWQGRPGNKNGWSWNWGSQGSNNGGSQDNKPSTPNTPSPPSNENNNQPWNDWHPAPAPDNSNKGNDKPNHNNGGGQPPKGNDNGNHGSKPWENNNGDHGWKPPHHPKPPPHTTVPSGPEQTAWVY